MTFLAAAVGFSTVQAQEGIVIAISDGDATIQCGAEETIYFTDDNSGGMCFKNLIRIRTTPSRCVPMCQGTRFR